MHGKSTNPTNLIYHVYAFVVLIHPVSMHINTRYFWLVLVAWLLYNVSTSYAAVKNSSYYFIIDLDSKC